MLKRGVIGVALAAVMVGGAIANAAARPRVNQAVRLGTLRQSAEYPRAGSSASYAGTVKSKLGRGAIVQTITIIGHPSPTKLMFRGTSTAFYSDGTTKGTFTGTGTLRADGRFALAGRGRYTGGTLYRRVRRHYSFSGTSPPPPPCAVPQGWQTVASDPQVIVILHQPDNPIQEFRYCNYANSSRGFQLLVRNDDGNFLGGEATYSTVDGVALSYILYHSTTVVDSPECNALGLPAESSTVYAVDTTSGKTASLDQGGGGIASALLSPPGVGAWILSNTPCDPIAPSARSESLKVFSFRTAAVTTLDSGDPGEMPGSPPSLGNLELYQCGAGCPANTVVVAWTHDGAWRYAQAS
jgi:hypothetical protein